MHPLKIHNFRVSHINDLTLGIEFRSHFKGVADAQQINILSFIHHCRLLRCGLRKYRSGRVAGGTVRVLV